MKRYLYGIIAVAALAITVAVLGISAAVADGGENANANDDSIAQPNAAFHVHILAPKAPVPFSQVKYSGTLQDILPNDLDVFVYLNMGTEDVTLELMAEDGSTHGDTMWVKALVRISPGDPFVSVGTEVCTSPADPCLISTPFPVGSIVLAVVGYIDVPGNFPAGYEFTATAF